MSENKETAIATVNPQVTALSEAIGGVTKKFLATHAGLLERVAAEVISPEDIDDIVMDLPEDAAGPLSEIIQRTNPNRKGIISTGESSSHVELRLYQGTGTDPNRPEQALPGHFYLTTKESIGGEFFGTPIAVWEGRTNWGERSEDNVVRMPVCNSMDRITGSAYGDCKSCPELPWRNGEKTNCANDVSAFMLMKNLKDIVLVRFQRSSEPAGRRLLSLAKRGSVPWLRWYKISSEEKKSGQRRWFVMNIEFLQDKVDTKLHPFCNAMCSGAERMHILPGMARIYAQADESLGEADSSNNSGVATEALPDYKMDGGMSDAPDNS